MIVGNIFNIQRFSLYDGPGIRTCVFFKGCPLKCAWCHNPEGLSARAQLGYLSDKCALCGECARACPRGAHAFIEGAHVILRDKCAQCMRCPEVCVYGALEAAGRETDVSYVMSVVERDRPFYARDGGITLTGGEPTAQPGFALALAKAAKAAGIHVCVETSGYCAKETVLALSEYTDEFLYDIKETDDERHIEYTGVSSGIILSNLSALDGAGARVILRCPIVPGFNARAGHITNIARIANAHACVKRIELEPYHSLGLGKRARFGMPSDARLPSESMPSALAREMLDTLKPLARAPAIIS